MINMNFKNITKIELVNVFKESADHAQDIIRTISILVFMAKAALISLLVTLAGLIIGNIFSYKYTLLLVWPIMFLTMLLTFLSAMYVYELLSLAHKDEIRKVAKYLRDRNKKPA